MLKALRWIVILVVVVAAFGFYRGWFRVKSDGDSVNVSVDKSKVEQDKDKARDKAQDLKDK